MLDDDTYCLVMRLLRSKVTQREVDNRLPVKIEELTRGLRRRARRPTRPR